MKLNQLLISGIILGTLSLGLSLGGCWTNDNEALKALDDNGFTNVVINDRGAIFAHFEGCGQDDQNWYKVVATNTAGKRVDMLVCCGGALSFKGCVIRSK